MPDYVASLLSIFSANDLVSGAAPIPPLVESLTSRDLEVLQLVAQGLTNQEIGERLCLALDTIKGHNHRIFGKLGVKNRTQAVRTAVSLKMVPQPPSPTENATEE